MYIYKKYAQLILKDDVCYKINMKKIRECKKCITYKIVSSLIY